MPVGSSQTLRDIYRDALRSFGRRFITHIACWLACAMGAFVGYVASLLAIAIAAYCVGTALDAGSGAAGLRMLGATLPAISALLMYPWGLAAWCVVEAAMLEVTHGDLLGCPIRLREALRAAVRRLPTQAGLGCVSFIAYLPVIGVTTVGIELLSRTSSTGPSAPVPSWVPDVSHLDEIRLALAAYTALVVALRARHVLAAACAQFEGLGVGAALTRSTKAVGGAHVRLGAARTLYWVATWCALALASRSPGESTGVYFAHPDTWHGPAFACMLIAAYVGMPLALSFDAVAVGVMHARWAVRESVDSSVDAVFR